jgi:hypothetical protein
LSATVEVVMIVEVIVIVVGDGDGVTACRALSHVAAKPHARVNGRERINLRTGTSYGGEDCSCSVLLAPRVSTGAGVNRKRWAAKAPITSITLNRKKPSHRREGV